MAKPFLNQDFLLESPTARKLYHEFAARQPIIDYHCHLPAAEIADDKTYANITELWLGGDHYKWRLMRSAGLSEEYCTGNQPDLEKFRAFCRILPQAIGNPLYHWSHLELRRYFDIDLLINAANADTIWEACNAKLRQPGFSARGLMLRSNVEAVCTTDDPIDDLSAHACIHASNFAIKVLPTFRPDQCFRLELPSFAAYIQRLGNVCDMQITRYADLCQALAQRVAYFHQHGCRVSDHGIDIGFSYACASPAELDAILGKTLSGQNLSALEAEQFKTAVLLTCGRLYAQHGWAMQLHIGALRNTNTRMFRQAGANIGFDSIADGSVASQLAAYLDQLDKTSELPKTILYTLNPNHNEVLATMAGNFQDGSCAGKIQFGAGWWFNDQKDGMLRQLTALSQLGNLGAFVGMLTDSRSFLSYTRHEYFRRILCNLIGMWVENGEYPADWAQLQQIIEGICYGNAKGYFKL